MQVPDRHRASSMVPMPLHLHSATAGSHPLFHVSPPVCLPLHAPVPEAHSWSLAVSAVSATLRAVLLLGPNRRHTPSLER